MVAPAPHLLALGGICRPVSVQLGASLCSGLLSLYFVLLQPRLLFKLGNFPAHIRVALARPCQRCCRGMECPAFDR